VNSSERATGIFATSSAGFVRVAQVQPDIANYLAIPGADEVEGDQPLDAAALIAIVDRWASRATEA
jgi:hypothetical protein